jgi:tetratricopeptide (TPR) repeat protein
MESKDPQERQIGIHFCELEYENLYHALQICLERQESVDIFFCLCTFFDRTNDIHSKLTLSEFVCKQHEKYLSELRTGKIGLEIVMSLDRLATCYLTMKNYPQAKTTYEKVLGLCEQLEDISKNQKLSFQASTYHNLGRVAQELREFEEARRNYQQALEINIEFGDRYSQASTYFCLGSLAEAEGNLPEAKVNF